MIARSSRQSFDLFNTLVCTKNSDERAGDVPVEDLVPMIDNIKLMQPQDLIVSDYYDETKAIHIVRDILKLDNKLIVSEDGKATGDIWSKTGPIAHHLGDNYEIDCIKPRRSGINTTWTSLWRHYNNPFHRGLYTFQTEMNFPYLLKVAHQLNNYVITNGYKRLLLCSRDCWFLHMLMDKLFKYSYEIKYFHSNRALRSSVDHNYINYVQTEIVPNTLIVDMCGTGESLRKFCDKHGGDPYYIMTLPGCDWVPSMVKGHLNESINVAPHAAITTWPHEFRWYNAPKGHDVMIEAIGCMLNTSLMYEPDLDLVQWANLMDTDERIKGLWSNHVRETIEYEKLF